jgi:hypothetical protein
VLRPLTFSVARWALPQELHFSCGRCAKPVFRQTLHKDPPNQDSEKMHPVRDTPPRCPERLPLAPCPTSQPGEDVSASSSFAPSSSHPFARLQTFPPPLAGETLHRATSGCLGAPCGSPRQPEKDACHQLLQPTHDTSTRRPLDSQARSLRRGDHPARALRDKPEEQRAGAASNRLAATRPQVDSRLTPRTQLRLIRERPLVDSTTKDGHPRRDATSPRRYRPRTKSAKSL